MTSRLDRLDRLQVQRAGLAVPVGADIIGQPLTGLGRGFLRIPGNCASLEAEIHAARFWLDRAVALVVVERIDGAKVFHDAFLCSERQYRHRARRRQR